jgi:hypothetical protein
MLINRDNLILGTQVSHMGKHGKEENIGYVHFVGGKTNLLLLLRNC